MTRYQDSGKKFIYSCHQCKTGASPISDEDLSLVLGRSFQQSVVKGSDEIDVPCGMQASPGCLKTSSIKLDSLRRSIRNYRKHGASFKHACRHCKLGGLPSILIDELFLKFLDLPRTILDFGPPATLSSRIWIICPQCDESRSIQLSSAQAVWHRRSADPNWEPLCTECANIDDLSASDEDISLYTEKLPNHPTCGRVYVNCKECQSTLDTSIRSLKNNIRTSRKRGMKYDVVCHICSSSGSHYVSLKECEEAGFYLRDETIDRFGRIPRYRSDMVVCCCTKCRNVQELKYDSLLRQTWDRTRDGLILDYNCQACSMQQQHVKSKLAASKARQHELGFRSSLEISTEDILKSLGLKFIPQYSLGFYAFDFFLPDSKMLIECQGDYWHSLPKNQHNDASKAGYVRNNHSNYRLLYLRESEFFNPILVRSRIAHAVDIGDSPYQIDFDLSRVTFGKLLPTKCDRSWKSIPKDFLDSYHYACYGKFGKIHVGAYLDNSLIGVAKFLPDKQKMSDNLNKLSLMELDRFCLHPNYQNAELATQFLSFSMNFLLTEFDYIKSVTVLVDPEFEFFSSICEQSGWSYLGGTDPDYFYIGPDGSALQHKVLSDRAHKEGFNEQEYSKKFGYSIRPTRSKLKYGRVM